MKVLILYRPNSEHARITEEFIHNYRERHEPAQLQTMDIDSREGSTQAKLYDIVQYPAIVASMDDGTPLKVWQGATLPLMDEVAAYART